MDPHTGKVYTAEEVEHLPPEIQQRLVRVPKGQVRRYKKKAKERKKSSYENADVTKRRAKNKRAKASRKRNRKG